MPRFLARFKCARPFAILAAAFFLTTPLQASASSEPVFLDVTDHEITIYEPTFRPFTVTEASLRQPGNEFDAFLEWASARRDTRPLVLLLRPGSALFQRKIRWILSRHGLPCLLEPWDEDAPISFSQDGSLDGFQAPLPDETAPATATSTPSKDQSPILFECRNNQIIRIDREQIEKACEERVRQIYQEVSGAENEFLKAIACSTVTVNGYRIDVAYSLTGSYLLMPLDSCQGHTFDNSEEGQTSDWFSDELARHDPARQYVYFIVRPDSFKAFRRARTIARQKGFPISIELLQDGAPIQLGLPGPPITLQ